MRAQEIFETKIFQGTYSHWNTQIYENPSLSALRSLVARMDLRGIVDGKNLFVWDASKMIHGFAVNAIAAEGKWEGDFKGFDWHVEQYGYDEPVFISKWCSYFYDPDAIKNIKDSGEWVSSPNARATGIDQYLLAPNLAISAYEAGIDAMKTFPNSARLFRNPKLLSAGRR